MRTHTAAIALLMLAGSASATPRETHSFAGPYGVWGEDDPRNTTLLVSFTGVDGGQSYTPRGLTVTLDMTSLVEITFAMDTKIRVTPPTGPSFDLTPSDEVFYTTIQDAPVSVRLPAVVDPVGTWTFTFYDVFLDSGPDSRLSNIRISLEDLSAAVPPEPAADLGVLGSGRVTQTVADYSGADVLWYKVTVPETVDAAGELYVDIDTAGSTLTPGNGETADNTMMAIYDAAGVVRSFNDDIYITVDGSPADPRSYLSFGAPGPRVHAGSPGVYTGANGTLYAGDYYIAVGAAELIAEDEFFAGIVGFSQGGAMVTSIASNFGGAALCSPADLGSTGGESGPDGRLDNNDFIVFIDEFFAEGPRADQGGVGGTQGADGAWDNNDFVAFIDHFFSDQAVCGG